MQTRRNRLNMAAFKSRNEAHTQQDLRVNLIHKLGRRQIVVPFFFGKVLVKRSDTRHEAFLN